jgi:CRP-like cAMP-binding protein
LGEGGFFGEGGLAGQLLGMSSATAMTDCVLLHIEKKAMMRALSLEQKLSAMCLKYLLKRNIRYQDDLVDQPFNSSEKRLARVLLLMAKFGKEGVSQMSVPPTKSGDCGRNGGDDPFARQLLHEPIQEARLYQLRRRRYLACPQFTPQRCSA